MTKQEALIEIKHMVEDYLKKAHEPEIDDEGRGYYMGIADGLKVAAVIIQHNIDDESTLLKNILKSISKADFQRLLEKTPEVKERTEILRHKWKKEGRD